MEKILEFLLVLLLGIVFDLAIAWVVMLLWNWIIPGIFGFATLSFWKALGLTVLCDILFKQKVNTSKN